MSSLTALRSVVRRARRRLSGSPWDGLQTGAGRDLAVALCGGGDDPGLVVPALRGLESQAISNRRDLLTGLLRTHPKPHHANRLLAEDEMARGSSELVSFPVNVWMDLSNVCTVQCRFCKYVHKHHVPEHLTLDHIQSIEWLKYVSLLNLSAGTAESIANPRFVEIFEWMRAAHPHLHLTLLSNGKTLDERILRALRDNLDALHVSMNAGNPEDYERVIKDGSWERFSRNLAAMKQIFAGSARPKVTASFVLMRWNLDRALQYLEFAHDHGAHLVLFHHYYTPYIRDLHQGSTAVLTEKFPREESLYYDRERADAMFDRIEERARELGVEVIVPPRFREPASSHIYFGVRTAGEPPPDCAYPWTNLYLLWGFKSRREEVTICCGLASDLGVFFDRDEIASESGLRAIWNAPTLQAYRRTVNGNTVNPICAKCRTIDRFDPDAEYPHQAEFFEYTGLPTPGHHSRRALPVVDRAEASVSGAR